MFIVRRWWWAVYYSFFSLTTAIYQKNGFRCMLTCSGTIMMAAGSTRSRSLLNFVLWYITIWLARKKDCIDSISEEGTAAHDDVMKQDRIYTYCKVFLFISMLCLSRQCCNWKVKAVQICDWAVTGWPKMKAKPVLYRRMQWCRLILVLTYVDVSTIFWIGVASRRVSLRPVHMNMNNTYERIAGCTYRLYYTTKFIFLKRIELSRHNRSRKHDLLFISKKSTTVFLVSA